MQSLRSPGVAGVVLQIVAAIIAVSGSPALWQKVLAVSAIVIIASWQAIAANNSQRGQERRDKALRDHILAIALQPAPDAMPLADRTLSEFQFAGLVALLSPHRGQRVVILASPGEETLAYANDFRRLKSARWRVRGPVPAPTNQIAGNLQLSINNTVPADGNLPAPFIALRGGLDFIGARSRQMFILDGDIEPGLIVLWVGPKTPANEWPGLRPPLAVGRLKPESLWERIRSAISGPSS